MRNINIVFSAAHLFVVFLLVGMGSLFLALPHFKEIQFSVVHFVLNEPQVFTKLGIVFTSFGVLLFGLFYFLNRKRYFQIKMKHSKALVDEAIIKEYITDYWQEAFPTLHSTLDIVIHPNQKIEVITASFPDIDDELKEDVFHRIQAELNVLLARRIGYEKDFTLTICER
ncbi:MAG: hypothetical protein HY860_06735 [Chlamydiales bacterium]|nr:hypothetical protein [Chlamydiales bacterium]